MARAKRTRARASSLPPPALSDLDARREIDPRPAQVDIISGGRLMLGMGAGWQQNEHVAYGIPFYTM
jgi:hypothetical protein